MFENLQERFDRAFQVLKGHGQITEVNVGETLKEVRKALLDADVDFKTAKNFTQRVKEKALGEKVLTSIKPSQLLIKITHKELTELMGNAAAEFKPSGNPFTILMAGLQGAGKTTHSGKIAQLLKTKHGKKPLLVACDVHRPAAVDQLHSTTQTRVFAVVATGGTTNLGIIDDLATIAEATHARDIWFHVDGAYGLAALCAPSVRAKFNGVEKADSLIVDPHKWLFAPYDACALVYRNPELARETHTQHASYLETLHDDSWSPSDYAIHLTRRVRGLPFWFSLAAHGTNAYTEAVEEGIRLAKESAKLISAHPNLELVYEPELSIVAFTRKGWTAAQYQQWSDALLEKQIGFIPPSKNQGEPILRFAFVNPWTSLDDVQVILDTL